MDNRDDGSAGHSALWLALQRLTRGSGIQRADLVEALAGELSELQRCWGVNLNRSASMDRLAALREVRHAMSANLDIHIKGLKPPRGVDRKKFALAVVVSFNVRLDKTAPDLECADLSQRRNWLARTAPAHLRISASTSQRYLNDAIRQIEQQILDSGYIPVSADAGPKGSDADEQAQAATDGAPGEPPLFEFKTPFIPRDRLLDRYIEAWSVVLDEPEVAPAWRVCLVGDAGAGKTRFIREHVAEFDSISISAETDEAMLPAMVDALARLGQDTAGLTEASLIKRAFGRFLAQPECPKVVVLDGVPDPVLLDQFIPRQLQTLLTITSRKRPPRDWAAVVEVGNMEDDEASLMIGALLPEADEADRQSLAIMMGCRPLLIEHACAFIRHSGSTDIQAFCAAVGQDIDTALSAITDATDRTLTAIYRRYIERLSHEAPASLQLLELLPFVTHQFIPPEYLMAYLLEVPYIKRDQLTRAHLAYEAAIRPLQAYSLVSVDRQLGVSMHTLVQNVLRRVFADRLAAVILRLQELTQKFTSVGREDLYREGWSALTVAGREACSRVLFTHAKDRFLQSGTLAQEGKIGGVQWGMLVTQLWISQMKFELLNLVGDGTIPLLKDGNLDWGAFLDGAAGRPRMQIEEMLGVVRIFKTIIPIQEGGAESETTEPMSTQEIRDTMVDNIMSMMRRYQDSMVGQLDLSIVNAHVLDPSQEGEARNLIRELLERVLHDKDEGAGSHIA